MSLFLYERIRSLCLLVEYASLLFLRNQNSEKRQDPDPHQQLRNLSRETRKILQTSNYYQFPQIPTSLMLMDWRQFLIYLEVLYVTTFSIHWVDPIHFFHRMKSR